MSSDGTGVIYGLHDPADPNGGLFYVGQTLRPLGARVSQHVCSAKKFMIGRVYHHGRRSGGAASRYIATAMCGRAPVAIVLERTFDDDLHDSERRWISMLQEFHHPLVNISEGGAAADKAAARKALSEAIRSVWAGRTLEERTKIQQKRLSTLSNKTPEQWSEIGRKRWEGKTPEQWSEIGRKGAAARTPEQRSESTRKGNASRTPEQRRESAQKRLASMTFEQWSEIGRKNAAGKTPEERSASARKQWAGKTPEERSERVSEMQAGRTPEERSAVAKKAQASRTPEERSEVTRKGHVTRARNLALKEIAA